MQKAFSLAINALSGGLQKCWHFCGWVYAPFCRLRTSKPHNPPVFVSDKNSPPRRAFMQKAFSLAVDAFFGGLQKCWHFCGWVYALFFTFFQYFFTFVLHTNTHHYAKKNHTLRTAPQSTCRKTAQKHDLTRSPTLESA